MFAATKGTDTTLSRKLFLIVALAVGQVVRAPDFSFLDALGALEIMDPKTDSGMIQGREDNDVSELQSLLPEELIWIMDQLLAREVSSDPELRTKSRSHGTLGILWRKHYS